MALTAITLAFSLFLPFQACQKEAIFDKDIQSKGGNGDGYEGLRSVPSEFSKKFTPDSVGAGYYFHLVNGFSCDKATVPMASHAGKIELSANGTAVLTADSCADASITLPNFDYTSYAPDYLTADGIAYQRLPTDPDLTKPLTEVEAFCRSPGSKNSGIGIALQKTFNVAIPIANKNLLRNTEEFEARPWVQLTTFPANVEIAPNGEKTAEKVIDTLASAGDVGQKLAQPVRTMKENTIYTFSAYVKPAERQWFRLKTVAKDNSQQDTFFNVGDGSKGTSTHPSSSITPVGNGWYRASVTFNSLTGSEGGAGLIMAARDNSWSYVGDGSSGLFAWGFQLEEGAQATNYVPNFSTKYDATYFAKIYTAQQNAAGEYIRTESIPILVSSASGEPGVFRSNDYLFEFSQNTPLPSGESSGFIRTTIDNVPYASDLNCSASLGI